MPKGLTADAGWQDVACVVVHEPVNIRDLVRDLLANPQVRALVFIGEPVCRKDVVDFWASTENPGFRIDMEHVELVRRFVDLYDDGIGWKTTPPPFWPQRIRYLEDSVEPVKEKS